MRFRFHVVPFVPYSASVILQRRYGLKVGRVHASRIPAKVVQVIPARIADHSLIRKHVCSPCEPAQLETAIPAPSAGFFALNGSYPLPAAVWTDSDLGPKPFPVSAGHSQVFT